MVLSIEITTFVIYGNYDMMNGTVYVLCLSNQQVSVKYELWKTSSFLFCDTLLPSQLQYKKVKTGSRIKMIAPGYYEITSLSKADEGCYKCRASLNGVTVEKEFNRPIWIS